MVSFRPVGGLLAPLPLPRLGFLAGIAAPRTVARVDVSGVKRIVESGRWVAPREPGESPLTRAARFGRRPTTSGGG